MTNHSERDRTVEQEQQCLRIYSKLTPKQIIIGPVEIAFFQEYKHLLLFIFIFFGINGGLLLSS